jgi:RimJ/RimL family protein N-acetyltransferase
MSVSVEVLEEAAPASPATRPGEGQTYLIGDTVYLRGLELGDAKWASAWRPAPFPISAELLEEQLKKEAPKQFEKRKATLVACRREDGRPVGSARIDDSEALEAFLVLHSDPTLGAAGERLQAEMLGLLVPWLSAERYRPVVSVATDTGLEPVTAQAEALGMRRSVQLRDGAWRDGRFRDRVFYEYLHPAWVARLGDPGEGIAEGGAPVQSVRAPAPRRDPETVLPLPQNAVIGSERLALRPLQVDDAEPIANLLRRDPDAGFGHSRFPYSAVILGDWYGEIGEDDTPSDVEFAVVLRETGELIGENGIYSIDWFARTAETGTWIYRPEYRGAGYGTEAKHLLLEYAFDRLGLHSVWSWVKSRNPRSQAALRKQGYRDAGRLNWTGFGPNGFDSARMFDLLASEWRAARDDAL